MVTKNIFNILFFILFAFVISTNVTLSEGKPIPTKNPKSPSVPAPSPRPSSGPPPAPAPRSSTRRDVIGIEDVPPLVPHHFEDIPEPDIDILEHGIGHGHALQALGGPAVPPAPNSITTPNSHGSPHQNPSTPPTYIYIILIIIIKRQINMGPAFPHQKDMKALHMQE